MMGRRLRRRFWAELGMAAMSAVLLAMTIVWSTWLELLFHVDPDQRSGSLEWLIVLAAVASTLLFAGAAGREWRLAAARA